MKTVYAIAVALTVSAPAFALQNPKPSRSDPNMKTVPYDPTDRVALNGVIGRSTMITYAPDETIQWTEFGTDKPDWRGPDPQKVPLKNNMALWPVKAGRENLQIVTLRADGTQRVYQYELNAREPSDQDDTNPDLTFGLVYTYPGDAKAAAAKAWQARRAWQVRRTAESRLSTDFYYGRSNYRYVAHGKDTSIAPTEVRDNGRLTGFRFPGNMHTPAIYTGACDGKSEKLAATTVWNDWIIAQTLAPKFCLRQGDLALEIINEAYDPIGVNPGTGTTSPDVVREVVLTK